MLEDAGIPHFKAWAGLGREIRLLVIGLELAYSKRGIGAPAVWET